MRSETPVSNFESVGFGSASVAPLCELLAPPLRADNPLVKLSQAAHFLGVHPDTILNWRRQGKSVGLRRLGNRWYLHYSEVQRLLSESLTEVRSANR
jgi:hypothetical protein